MTSNAIIKDSPSECQNFGNAENELARNTMEVCNLCVNSIKHPCRKCGRNVCILFCSIPDPNLDNEMHVVHKDPKRCFFSSLLEYPSYDKTFTQSAALKNMLVRNMNKYHFCLLF